MRMKKIIFLLSAAFIFPFIKCSHVEKDSLDEIKNYKPDDRYFKANVKSMHFMIETRVDAISGATYSLFRFRYALSIALMKARLANR